MKSKFFETYKVAPPLKFTHPAKKRDRSCREMQADWVNKAAHKNMAAPCGYDPRQPFTAGSNENLRVIAYQDKKTDKMVNITKLATGR